MAFSYIHFNSGLQHGAMLRTALTRLEQGRNELFAVRDVMIQMRDGDGSQAAHYTQVKIRFDFPDDATAKAAFEELASACSKLEGNASVTDVRAALDQLFAKMRG